MRRFGIDIGGHTITAAEVDFTGSIPAVVMPETIETPETRDLSDVIGAVGALVSKRVHESEECFVGLCIPGFLDRDRRHIVRLTNFKNCDGAEAAQLMERFLAARGIAAHCAMENDANCAALGEEIAGAARGMTDFAVITLGTGIGSGIVTGGRLLTGAHGFAAEFGHIALKGDHTLCHCGCQGMGHLEEIASADNIENSARALGLPGDFHKLWDMRFDDERAYGIIIKASDALARGIASLASLFDPETVILSGGMSRADGLVDEISKLTVKYLPFMYVSVLDIVKSELGSSAAVIGAASLLRSR